MITQDYKPEWIRALHQIGLQLRDVTVKLPSESEIKRAKTLIEQILPPPSGGVHESYVRDVLMGEDYAKTHFCNSCSMLEDIKAGREIDMTHYRKSGGTDEK